MHLAVFFIIYLHILRKFRIFALVFAGGVQSADIQQRSDCYTRYHLRANDEPDPARIRGHNQTAEAMNPDLRHYIEQTILPQYDTFDGGHRRDHALTVIDESLKLAQQYNADEQMAYTIATYHDIGLRIDRELHHIHSGEILMADLTLRQWFTEEQLHVMKEAVEDHRASGKNPPRTIYGAIVAEADRQIEPLTVIHRTMAYSAKLYPEGDFNTLYERSLEHLHEKYAEGGYMRLWLNSDRNVRGLNELRAVIRNEEHLRSLCREWYDSQAKR